MVVGLQLQEVEMAVACRSCPGGDAPIHWGGRGTSAPVNGPKIKIIMATMVALVT
jgi:hypothetical protein